MSVSTILLNFKDAESFIKELAKIDPRVMKKYNFEGFLLR
jgi:hypothetical protein